MNVTQLYYRAPVTTMVSAMCLGVFVLTALQSRSLSNVIWGSRLGTQMVLYGPFVADETFGWLRVVSAGFLHVDLTHLAVNLFMLALIGTEVERFIGSGPYAVVFAAGLVGSSLSVLAMNFQTPTAGASGAVYALMAVLLAVAYRRHTDLRAPFALIALNIVFTLVSPGVSLWGHVGGLVAGLVVALPVTSTGKKARYVGPVLVLLVAAVGVLLELSTGYPQLLVSGIVHSSCPHCG
ncbi:rhomboid family intramembrane serine protease [Corynebacterium mayonis]|uniref:rhomboid family intramembrane serine protease n=1 Tax=Corynebacterium mayonis TaxID=3062461 RepID=UPI00313FEBEF